jgi:hypothetical protein
MKSQMEEMKLQWHTFLLSLRERESDLESMNREMDRLPAVTGLGRDTLNVSLEALREAEEVQRKVATMTARISEELRVRITELQSFSPDELGNIPRRREQSNLKFLKHKFKPFGEFPQRKCLIPDGTLDP